MVRLWEKLKRGKFYKSFRSLRIRVFCLIILTGIIPCIVLHFGILERYLNNAVAVRTSEVQTQVRIIADHLITYNYLLDSSSDIVNAELSQLSNLYDGRVLIIDSNMKIIKDTYAVSEGKTIISGGYHQMFQGRGCIKPLAGNKIY